MKPTDTYEIKTEDAATIYASEFGFGETVAVVVNRPGDIEGTEHTFRLIGAFYMDQPTRRRRVREKAIELDAAARATLAGVATPA